MANTDISICSIGLMQIGGKPINSFDTPGDTARFLKLRYPLLRDHLISIYPWECMKERRKLTRASEEPGGYQYAFVIPGDALSTPYAVFTGENETRGISAYEIRQNRIVTNAPEIWAEFTTRRPEAQWPAWFANMVAAAVSAECAFLVTDQSSVQEEWRGKAYGTPSEGGMGGLVGQCMIIDSQGSGNNPGIADDAFVAARFGVGFLDGAA